jgi:hypothetical protein
MRSQFSREFMRSVFAFRNLRNSHFFHYKPNPRNRVSLKTSTTISDSTPIETGFLPSPNAQCSVGYLGFSRGVRSRVTGFVVLSGRCFVGEEPNFSMDYCDRTFSITNQTQETGFLSKQVRLFLTQHQ